MSRIWKSDVTLEELNASSNPETMLGTVDIRFTRIGDDFLEATMPVDRRTRQPFGILHGGASCVLSESVGSVASHFVAGDDYDTLGIEISASHVKAVTEGRVTGRATPIHLGKSLHVWEIRITDDKLRLVCVSRLSVMIRPKRAK